MIYLDNNSTTKIDPRVLEVMMPFLKEQYANASSNHKFGSEVNQYVNEARRNIADLIGCDSTEIIFTSGATEAINLAIKGIALENTKKGKHIITVSTEHPAVLDTCRFLETIGYEVTYLMVKSDGLLDIELVKECLREDTILVTVMYINNETGVIQPIQEIAEIAHSKGAFFMTDATQAVGKISIQVYKYGIDLMCLSSHKFYGPKGIGVLFVRNRHRDRPKLTSLLHGGGQENGLRSGTLNVPGIVGLGRAAEIAKLEMKIDAIRIKELRDYLEENLLKVHDTFLNGNRIERLYNVSNICFKNVDADAIIVGLKSISISNGSACSSDSIEPSHVLMSMGRSESQAFSSLRFSLGKFNTKVDIELAIKEVLNVVYQLRELAL